MIPHVLVQRLKPATYFLKVPGIRGKATGRYAGWIEISSVAKAKYPKSKYFWLTDLELTKRHDTTSSQILIAALASLTPLPEVVLAIVNRRTTRQIRGTEVRVHSVGLRVHNGSHDVFTINAATWQYHRSLRRRR